jgi:hypothetical protein
MTKKNCVYGLAVSLVAVLACHSTLAAPGGRSLMTWG